MRYKIKQVKMQARSYACLKPPSLELAGWRDTHYGIASEVQTTIQRCHKTRRVEDSARSVDMQAL